MNQEFTDNELVQKTLEDADFFAVLMDRYERRLLFYILRISAFDILVAEEILQEVFLKVWKNLRDFDPSLSFSSWIYRITHNETISSFRKSQTRGEDKQSVWDDEHINTIASALDIEHTVDAKLQKKRVAKVLSTLSGDSKEVLVLRFFEDLSYSEIADVLKKPEGTVATLINRAKKQFCESYERINSPTS